MITLHYKTIPGFLWNAVQKITMQTGISTQDIGMSSSGSGVKITIFKDITEEQKGIIDRIMLNNPFEIPLNPNTTTFKIMDIWGMRQRFSKQLPAKPVFWFEEEQEDGSGECYLYLQFPRILTPNEKKQVIDIYSANIKEVK